MKLRWSLLGLLLLAVTAQAAEQMTAADAAGLMRKMNFAARMLNYSGVYLYQEAQTMETLRLVHLFDASGEQERRESLDGMPREYIRNSEMVVMNVPNKHSTFFDRQKANKWFPGIAPDQIADVLANYNFVRLDNERVAGYECQAVWLEPKDGLRHPHKLCIEPGHGLMLKSVRYSPERGEPIEQAAFTQLEFTVADKKLLKPVYGVRGPVDAAKREVAGPNIEVGLEARRLPQGFRLIKEARSRLLGGAVPAAHYLYSDGLAEVSVFIEPASNAAVTVPIDLKKRGNISFFARQTGTWRVTAIGPVPLQTVKLFTQAFEER
ncbi:MucB/RseB C-terminal domain-containing protein [Chitinimonas lacunae]|uniref:MucB/RseB C-terminal domain-containing protein n=1 Tax=Chitinimonas lacunae TaxID=1963018 RepID=A0ABV8MM11_9NEIS